MKSPGYIFRMLFCAALAMLVIGFTFQSQIAYGQEGRPEPPKIVRKTGGVLVGEAITKPSPVYPPLARAAKISGSVVVEIQIDEAGAVISARALSGHPLLKDAAVEAARQWTFKPTQLSGVPVKVIGTITFNFTYDHTKEIEALKEQLSGNPSSADLHYQLGMLYHYDSRYDLAIEEFKQSLSLQPNTSGVYFALGESLVQLMKVDEAIEAYSQGLNLNPLPHQAERAHIELGNLYLRQNRNNEALESFKQAVGINPSSEEGHAMMCTTYLKIGDKQGAMSEVETLKRIGSKRAEYLQRMIDQ